MKISEENFKENSDGSPRTEAHDDAEACNDFWSFEEDFICRHHAEPRVHLYVPKEESFPIPLRFFDVTRTSHTNLDVLQEKRIDNFWNVDDDRLVSDSRTGFTRFTLLNEKPPGYGVHGALYKDSSNYQT